MIRCQYLHCTEAAELLFTGRTVAPRTPLCEQHARELLRHCRGMGIVTLDNLTKETEANADI